MWGSIYLFNFDQHELRLESLQHTHFFIPDWGALGPRWVANALRGSTSIFGEWKMKWGEDDVKWGELWGKSSQSPGGTLVAVKVLNSSSPTSHFRMLSIENSRSAVTALLTLAAEHVGREHQSLPWETTYPGLGWQWWGVVRHGQLLSRFQKQN